MSIATLETQALLPEGDLGWQPLPSRGGTGRRKSGPISFGSVKKFDIPDDALEEAPDEWHVAVSREVLDSWAD